MAYEMERKAPHQPMTTKVSVAGFLTLKDITMRAAAQAMLDVKRGAIKCPVENFDNIYPTRRQMMISVKLHLLGQGMQDRRGPSELGMSEETFEQFSAKVRAFWPEVKFDLNGRDA